MHFPMEISLVCFLAPFSFLKDINEEWSPSFKNPHSSHKYSWWLSRKTEAGPTLTCSFLFPGRTSILGISFGAAFLSLAFILFVCFAGQLLVGTSHMELLWKVCSLNENWLLNQNKELVDLLFHKIHSPVVKPVSRISTAQTINWGSP